MIAIARKRAITREARERIIQMERDRREREIDCVIDCNRKREQLQERERTIMRVRESECKIYRA